MISQIGTLASTLVTLIALSACAGPVEHRELPPGHPASSLEHVAPRTDPSTPFSSVPTYPRPRQTDTGSPTPMMGHDGMEMPGMTGGTGMPAMKNEVPSSGPPHADAKYTCPMHPEIRVDAAGSCPKCGMTLEPASSAPHKPEGNH